jgi:hypothetical protein
VLFHLVNDPVERFRFSATLLERQADLEPNVLSERKMKGMLGTIFDTLLGLRDQTAQTKRALE